METQEEVTPQEPVITQEETTEESQEEVTEAPQEETEYSVTIDGEDKPETEGEKEERTLPAWVKAMRKENRKLQSKLKELEKKSAPRQEEDEVLPKRPKLSDDGINYDEEEFDRQLDTWYAKKAEIENRRKARETQAQKRQNDFQARLASYEAAKSEKNLPDFADAEEEVNLHLPPERQAMLMTYADDPAKLVYALGRNPKILQELKETEDHGDFLKRVILLEQKVQITPKETRKPQTQPEKILNGSGGANGEDKVLKRLEEEAYRTRDRTKVQAYKRNLERKRNGG